ncbi:MAG: VCBS repeat-containing protein, partial [Candidatus Latescibacteria bacterium]|nr:VCBS repeat-containing protein [Candidatus Latescibacterota bacterium]
MKDELMLELPTTNPPFHVSSTLLPLFLILAVSCNTPSSTEPVQALPDVRFTDISTSSGLSFKHSNGKSGRYYFIETVASGGGFIDYDGDGDLDMYLVNEGANHLLQNQGDGSFDPVTETAGTGLADESSGRSAA